MIIKLLLRNKTTVDFMDFLFRLATINQSNRMKLRSLHVINILVFSPKVYISNCTHMRTVHIHCGRLCYVGVVQILALPFLAHLSGTLKANFKVRLHIDRPIFYLYAYLQ